MAAKNIGFGLVGIGMSGGFMAKELDFVDGGELVAVCSRNESNVREFARTNDAGHWFTDYRRLVEHEDVDVVVVSVPTGLHAEVTIAASNAGKHALVEKPLDTTLERADRMIAVCRANNTKLGVVFQMRFGGIFKIYVFASKVFSVLCWSRSVVTEYLPMTWKVDLKDRKKQLSRNIE